MFHSQTLGEFTDQYTVRFRFILFYYQAGKWPVNLRFTRRLHCFYFPAKATAKIKKTLSSTGLRIQLPSDKWTLFSLSLYHLSLFAAIKSQIRSDSLYYRQNFLWLYLRQEAERKYRDRNKWKDEMLMAKHMRTGA